MVALAERLLLELDSSDRKNLVGGQRPLSPVFSRFHVQSNEVRVGLRRLFLFSLLSRRVPQ